MRASACARAAARVQCAAMLIDTHAHLTFPELAAELEEVLARAAEAGVTRIITIGTSVESSRAAVALAEKHPAIFAAVGIHPDSAVETSPGFIEELRQLAQSPRVVAIGETGLDYFRRTPEQIAEEKPIQAAVCRAQLDLAVELGLNVIIHERAAWDDTLALIQPYSGKLRAVFHCFGKTLAEAESVLALGHLVSFTGIVTFKNAAVVQDTAARVPSGALMVETDCPYLAPTPFRGKRCEPAHTRQTAEHVAQFARSNTGRVGGGDDGRRPRHSSGSADPCGRGFAVACFSRRTACVPRLARLHEPPMSLRHLVLALCFATPLLALAEEPATFPVGGLTFTRPANWKWIPVSSPMRKAQLQVPGAGADQAADVTFFYFGEGGGGGVEANAQRWLKQFSGKAGAEKIEPQEINGAKVTLVTTEGTFASGMPGGPSTPLENQALLGAIDRASGGLGFRENDRPGRHCERSARTLFLDFLKTALPAKK